VNVSMIIAEIAAERARQIAEEGWTPEQDDGYSDGELARAASAYAYAAYLPEHLRKFVTGIYSFHNDGMLRDLWPRSWSPMKPKDRRRDLIRAAALIVAEIERLDRLAAREAIDG